MINHRNRKDTYIEIIISKLYINADVDSRKHGKSQSRDILLFKPLTRK